jgi:hypothetical protein
MTSKHLIPTQDEGDLGPAMYACSKQERIFVRALFEKPGYGAGARAARAAGYGNKGGATNTPARSANRLFNRPRVIAAIAELTGQSLRSDGPMAVHVTREIMADKEHKDRLKAARTVLERADPAETKFSGEMHHTISSAPGSDAEGIKLLAWLKSQGANQELLLNMFGLNGLPRLERKLIEIEDGQRAKLNGENDKPVDAEFVEIRRAPATDDDGDDEAADA